MAKLTKAQELSLARHQAVEAGFARHHVRWGPDPEGWASNFGLDDEEAYYNTPNRPSTPRQEAAYEREVVQKRRIPYQTKTGYAYICWP